MASGIVSNDYTHYDFSTCVDCGTAGAAAVSDELRGVNFRLTTTPQPPVRFVGVSEAARSGD
jgi:hypothetical protein